MRQRHHRTKRPRNRLTILSLGFALVLAMLTLTACGTAPASTPQAPATGSAPAAQPAAEAPASGSTAQPAAGSGTQAAPAAAGPQGEVKSSVSIGTHPQGASYNVTGAGIAKVVSENTPVKITVKPFAGPNAWMPLLNSGELDLGVISAPDAGWAFNGVSGFKEPNKNVRTLVYGNYLTLPGFTIRQDANISKVADLKGKPVASGYAGNQIIHLVLEAQLATVGLSWDDIVGVPVTDIATGMKAVRENRAIAAFGGAPTTAPVLEVDSAVSLTNLSFGDWDPNDIANFPAEMLAEMRKRVPGAAATVIKGGTGWVKRDSVGMSYPIILVANAQMSEATAYEIVKGLWENDTELHPIYDWLKGWKQDTFFNSVPPTPYHPGAVRFFKEAGVWTDEAEKNQQELLKQAQ